MKLNQDALRNIFFKQIKKRSREKSYKGVKEIKTFSKFRSVAAKNFYSFLYPSPFTSLFGHTQPSFLFQTNFQPQ